MGSHLAKMLSGNGHDITIIDADQKLLADVGSLADVITVEGDSTTFAVLRKASGCISAPIVSATGESSMTNCTLPAVWDC